MHGCIATLQVLVCGAYIAVPCLVSCYDYALTIGEVTETTILKAVELVAVTPAEPFAHQRIPLASEHFAVAACR